MYGDQQAHMTNMRAGYGDIPAYMYGSMQQDISGAGSGLSRMMSDLGSHVMPVTYTPPARVNVGFYGQYVQEGGFFTDMARTMGMGNAPRATNAYDYGYYAASSFGERVGGAAAGMATTAAGLAASMTIGRVAGAWLGGAAGSLLGPAGAAAGAFLGREVGSFALGMTPAGWIMDAVGERRAVQGYLENSSFRYIGAGSADADHRTGGGFSREARQNVASFMHQMDVNDRSLNFSDLGNILQQSSSMGMMSGTGDLDSFKQRFKEIVDTVKTVTRTLNVTLEEGMQTLRDLRQAGIDPNEARTLVQTADALGRASGRTGQEMIGIGLQGAELFRGTGVEMGIGMRANMMNVSAVRAARDAGTLSSEAVAQAGGEEALAQRMTASGLSFMQSSLGRGLGGAFFNASMPGGFNAGAFANAMGSGSLIDMANQAAGNLADPANLIKYQANMHKFATQMGNMYGGQGLQMASMGMSVSEAEYLSRAVPGLDAESAYIHIKRGQGRSPAEIEAELGMMRNAQGGFEAAMAGGRTTMIRGVVDAAERNSHLYRLWDGAVDSGKRVVNAFSEPISMVMDNVGESTTTWWEETNRGVQRATTRGIETSAFSGRSGPIRRLKRTDLDAVGGAATSAGEAVAEALFGSHGLGGRFGIAQGASAESDVILDKRFWGGPIHVSREGLERFASETSLMRTTVSDAQKLRDEGKLDAVSGALGDRYRTLLTRGGLSEAKDMVEVVERVTGKDWKDVSKEEFAFVQLEAQKTSELKDVSERGYRAAMSAQSAVQALGTADLAAITRQYGDVKGKIESIVGRGFTKGSLEFAASARERLAAAAKLPAGPEKSRLEAQAKADEETAMQAMMESGVTSGAATKAVELVSRGTGRIGELGDELVPIMLGINSVQRERASQIYEAALLKEISGGDAKLSKAEAARSLDVVKMLTPESLMSLGKEDIAALGKTAVGKHILDTRSAIEGIQKLDPAKATEKEVAAALKPVIQDKDEMAQMVKLWSSDGSRAVSNRLLDRNAKVVAGEDAASAAGAGATGTGNEAGAGSAVDAFATQIQVNMEVYQLLRQLSVRINAS